MPPKGTKVATPKPKKRTRRAVKARRTLEEQEAAAEKLLTQWEGKLDTAISKVQFYRRELKNVRKRQAKQASAKVFST